MAASQKIGNQFRKMGNDLPQDPTLPLLLNYTTRSLDQLHSQQLYCNSQKLEKPRCPSTTQQSITQLLKTMISGFAGKWIELGN